MSDQETNQPVEPESGEDQFNEFASPLQFEELAEQVEEVDELTKLQEEKEELEDRLARTQAELVNYRRRTENETSQFRKYEGLNLVRDLLPAIDNLKRAVSVSGEAVNADDLKTGINMVIQQVQEVLSKFKIEKIEAEAQEFDPNLHEAVQQIPSEQIAASHIVQELETGYKMHDRIVRPGKVIVSTGAPEAGTE